MPPPLTQDHQTSGRWALVTPDMPGNIHVPTPQEVAQWPTPNYEHGVRREWLPTFCLVLLVFSTILTFTRIILRVRKQGGGLGWDDALLIPSWLFLIGFTSCVLDACYNGTIDRHMWDMELWKYENYALNAWVGQFIFLIGTACIKISILLFHRRMVKGTFKRRWKWGVWLAIAFTILYSLMLLIFLIINCSPTESYWKYLDPTYSVKWHCMDTKWINYVAGIFAVVSDFYSLCLPWAMIWPLQMPKKQKIALNAVFSLGIVTIVAACLRTVSLVALGYSTDLTWNGFYLYLWSVLEWNLGIICACAPSLRVVLKKILSSSMYKSWSSGSTRNRTACGAPDQRYWEESNAQPARVIQLRRTLTVESSAPIMKSNEEKHFVSQTESEATTVTQNGDDRASTAEGRTSTADERASTADERTASFASSRRQGVSYVPRAYRIALRQDLSESQETLRQMPTEQQPDLESALPQPMSSNSRADQDTIAQLMRGG